VAFAVVAGATLIFRSATIGEEGFSGGSGGDDKECAKLGLKPLKIDKNDIKGSLEKAHKTIKAASEKHWQPVVKDEDKTKKLLEEFQKVAKELKKDDSDQVNTFVFTSAEFYDKDSMDKILDNASRLSKFISGGKITIKLFDKLNKSSKLDSDLKKIVKYLNCLCKYWINIYKEVQKATGGGDEKGDDEGEDGDEEKPKKKNTKKNANKKKKKKSGDDEDAADEDE
jgi:hypothetical protein